MSMTFTDRSLNEIFKKAALTERTITFIKGANTEEAVSYHDLYSRSLSTLYQFQQAGIKPGDELILQLEDNKTFLIVFWACLLGKIIPVPVSIGTSDDHKFKLLKIWERLTNPHLICDSATLSRLREFSSVQQRSSIFSSIEQRTITPEYALNQILIGVEHEAQPNDIAYIQFSSGSTGDPKGVVLTHANLVANTNDISSRSAIGDGDAMLSWMPLTHDMGLICFHLTGVLKRINQYLMPTSLFIKRPVLWLEKASHHKVSLLYSPNFGYQYFLSSFDRSQSEFDLSAVRLIYNGAEPISWELCHHFLTSLSVYKLSPTSIFPGYGLAEASVAVSLPIPGQTIQCHHLNRHHLQIGKPVRDVMETDTNKLTFVQVGYPIEHCEVKIVDDKNKVLSEDFVGHIQIKGDNVTSGYYNEKGKTDEIVLQDGWLKTGDLGFIRQGALIVTGRAKNIIIFKGQNFYPQDLERLAQQSSGLELGKVVACSANKLDSAEDEILIFILFKGRIDDFAGVASSIRRSILKNLGLYVDKIIPVTKIPKTTSGKIQNFKLLEQYNARVFDKSLRMLEELQGKETVALSLTYTEITEALKEIYSSVFNGKEIDADADLLENEFDSLRASQFSFCIQEHFNVSVSLRDILAHPTLRTLADFIGMASPAIERNHLKPVSPASAYDVSEIQRRFWFLEQLSTTRAAATISLAYHIEGEINVGCLSAAVDAIVKRHENLRTVFEVIDGQLKQRIRNFEDLPQIFTYVDLPFDKSDYQEGVEWIAQQANFQFDLYHGPLIKIGLVQYSHGRFMLVITIHHIVSDGWSMGVIFNELRVLYQNQLTGTDHPLPELSFHYKDFVYWKRDQLNEQKLKIAQEYWINQLNGFSLLELPVSLSSSVSSHQGQSMSFDFDPADVAELQRLAKEGKVTLYMTLVALINALFFKYTGQHDIVLGSDAAGRNFDSFENQTGNFLNTLTIRTKFEKESSFVSLLQVVKEQILNALEYQDYPVDLLIKDLHLSQSTTSPLFNVLVLLQNFGNNFDFKQFATGLTLRPLSVETDGVLTDLQFQFIEQESSLRLEIRYSSLFSIEQVKQIGLHVRKLMKLVSQRSEIPIIQLDILTDEEHNRLKEYNSDEVVYPNNSIVDLFESSVRENPNSIALIYNENEYAYSDLNRAINRLAHYLRHHKSVGAGSKVGIMISRSEYSIICMLAILKAGGVYVHIDPEYPIERIRFIITDSAVDFLIGDNSQANLYPNDVLSLAEVESVVQKSRDDSNLTIAIQPSDIAYIIYTSGTTGVPKGVKIKHESLVDYVFTFKNYFNVSKADVVLQQASFSFDTVVEEVFPILCASGKLVVSPNGGRDVNGLCDLIEHQHITLLSTTPLIIQELNRFPEVVCHLRILISGGDVLYPEYVDKIISKVALFNTYGPTESTVCSTYHRVENIEDVSCIGKPIPNRKIYITDEFLHLSPPGFVGEICIAGKGLAAEYLNRAKDTTLKFVISPFSHEVIYRTGDFGRWTERGELIFIGRKDSQLKIRGYRVEIGEVEQVLLQHESVKEVVVVEIRTTSGSNYLAAYFVPQGSQKLRLKSFLKDRLPDYMMPQAFVEMEFLPKAISGKIDKSSLPAINPKLDRTKDALPKNSNELAFLKVYRDLFKNENLGMDDHFFDAGGNSIRATQLIALVQERLSIKLTLTDVFSFPLVRDLAEYALSRAKEMGNDILPIDEGAQSYPLSSAQRRLWIIDQFQESKKAYILSWAFRLKGTLDVDAFRNAFWEVIRNHEILRTVFIQVSGEPLQHILNVDSFLFEPLHRNLKNEANPEREAQRLLVDYLQAPFILDEGPLLRVAVLQTDADSWIWGVSIHHLIIDGWSINTLTREFVDSYNNLVEKVAPIRKPLAIQYKDFAAWHNKQLSSGAFEKERQYWIGKFADGIPTLNFPLDFARPAIQSYEGSEIRFSLNKDLTRRLRDIAGTQDASLFIVIVSSVCSLLYRYTGQTDMVIGTAIAGRTHSSLEDQIGLYLNTLALRCTFSLDSTFNELVTQVRKEAMGAYDNQRYPFDQLLEDLPVGRNVSRSPLFDVMVGFQETHLAYQHLNLLRGLTAERLDLPGGISQFDFSIDFFDVGDHLDVMLEYNSDIFKKETIQRFVSHYIKLLHSIASKPETSLVHIEWLENGEKEQVLTTFNPVRGYPKGEAIHQLFEQQVTLHPDAIAIICGEKILTYQQVNTAANRLAHFLRDTIQVQPGDLIGILLDRSEWMVISLLGILKSGAAYLPIDHDYPVERIRHIIKDSNICCVLGNDKTLSVMEEFDLCRVNLTVIESHLQTYNSNNPANRSEAEDLAYVIYTSASTGLPKGVMVEHGNLTTVAHSWLDAYQLNSFPVCLLQVASIAFDVFTGDVCRALLSGGQMVICPAYMRGDSKAVYQLMRTWRINVVESTPSLILPLTRWVKSMNHDFSFMRLLILGSDTCTAHDFKNLVADYGHQMRIINSYGTTESTIDSSFYEASFRDIPSDGNLPIGKPLGNTRLYVLDAQMNLLPVGLTGELYIGGAGVGRGYLNRPLLTVERYVADPYRSGERLYKTGDQARWLADGNIEFLGRNDHQVKIRGYRIELGEIESLLLSYPLINQVLVVARQDDGGDRYLVAYLVSDTELSSSSLRDYLRSRLPDYMIPSYYVQLDSFPLTLNGKIDRTHLPSPEGISLFSGVHYVGGRNELELSVIGVWEEVLKRERIGIHDNFFEIGGHSLKATQIVSRLHSELNLETELRSLFLYPTIASFCSQISHTAGLRYELIPVVAAAPDYPLSHAQHRLWILDQFEQDGLAYSMPAAYEFSGALDVVLLERSLQFVVQRHEILRTVFVSREGSPRQKIYSYEDLGFQLEYSDLSSYGDSSRQVKEFVVAEASRRFDLSTGPLIRARLIRRSFEDHVFVFNIHHIVSDGWSTEVLIKEVVGCYNRYRRGEDNDRWSPLRVQYKDYSAWQKDQLLGSRLQSSRTYWLKQLSGSIPVLELPTDFVRPAIKTFRGNLTERVLSPELTSGLQNASGNRGVSLFMTLLSGLHVLFYRYTGQSDQVLGTAIAGRSHSELENQIGFYVNTLAIRSKINGKDTFGSFLSRVKENVLNAYTHQEYPFDLLVEELDVKRDLSRSPLFDVLVVHQQTAIGVDGLDGMEGVNIKEYKIDQEWSKFDLTINLRETSEGICVSVDYNTSLFRRERIDQLLVHYENLLTAVVGGQSEVIIDLVDYLGADEKHLLLHEYNNTASFYPSDKTIHELFEAQVARTPESIALVFEQEEFSYEFLNSKSNQLAHYLRTHHSIKADDLVGLLVDNSPWTVIGILGILKAGAAYVPIDISNPQDRIRYMVEDASLKALLIDEVMTQDRDWISSLPVTQIRPSQTQSERSDNLPVITAPEDLMYVIYTSGSTGLPKGVMIEHRAVSNLSQWLVDLIYKTEQRPLTALLTASTGFDASVQQLFAPLLCGSKLVIVPAILKKDVEKYVAVLVEQEVDIIDITPSYLKSLLLFAGNNSLKLKYVLVGGEPLSMEVCTSFDAVFAQQCQLINVYGITEATVDSTFEIVNKNRASILSIGKPLGNTRLYVLDAQMNLLPVGLTGELYIGGAGVGRGYLNRPLLTVERYVADPYRSGERLYKTGDQARWLADGNIEFLGRNDHQVKIRGYRIELGEIESLLLSYPLINQVLVVARQDDGGDRYLVAYLVSDTELSSSSLRDYLRSRLPDYMIPSYYVQLDSFPLTLNGKIDRTHLPSPEGISLFSGVHYVGGRNELELSVIGVWEEVLKRERIGIHDNFFEIGGHSLKATQIVSRLHSELNLETELRSLFLYPTIASFCSQISHTAGLRYELIPVVAAAPDYPLSHAQHRLWILDQFEQDGLAYSMPAAYEFSGALDVVLLERSLQFVVQRHEILRTVFVSREGSPRQKIYSYEDLGFQLEYSDLSSYGDSSRQVKEFVVAEASRRFDLSTGPLIRARLIRRSFEDHVFVFNIHHIVSDGWSTEVLIKEVVGCYNRYRRGEDNDRWSPLRVQYKDYSAWQKDQLLGSRLQSSRTYWLKQLSGSIPVLELPTDFVRPAIKTFRGNLTERVLSPELTSGLQNASGNRGVSLFMTLLSGLHVLFYRYTGQSDQVLGTAIAGRSHSELENQIGFYVNTLAIRSKINGKDTFGSFLSRVKENVLNAYTHQEYPFDLLVEELDVKRDLSRSPLFDVLVVHQQTAIGVDGLDGMEGVNIKEYKIDQEWSKFDLTINLRETSEGICVSVDYNTSLFRRERIDQLLVHYENLLTAVVGGQSEVIIDLVDYLGADEKHLLLHEYNNTASFYPSDKTIHELFEAQVARTPESIALVFEQEEFSYEFLNSKSNQLAHYLRTHHSIKADDLVGLLVDNSPWTVIGILGILKAGAAYVPIDISNPQDRIRYMVEDASLKALLIDEVMTQDRDWISSLPVTQIRPSQTQSERSDNLPVITAPEDLMYVIYTSGSTGLPKGVMIEHRNIVNIITGLQSETNAISDWKYLLSASIAFDASVKQLFIPLTLGGELHVIRDIKDIHEIINYVTTRTVQVVHFSPSVWLQINSEIEGTSAFDHVKLATSGGEQLSPSLAGKLLRLCTNADIRNTYGPTEVSINATQHKLSDAEMDASVIGKPLPNYELFILDEFYQLLPVGVAGQICVSGDGLARGYLNQPALTDEKFVPHPFMEGKRLYLTGDQGRISYNGNLEFISRKDRQVKIRGFRVELPEIENQLNGSGMVDDAVVVFKEIRSEFILIAYVISRQKIDQAGLLSYLRTKLPGYMIPANLCMLDKFPITKTGKLDYSKLPEPRFENFVYDSTPTSELEMVLMKIWEEVLGNGHVGLEQNFFDCGGHSLKAIQVISRIRKELHVKIELRTFFTNPTVRGLAELVKVAAEARYEQISIVPEQPFYDLSRAQKRLWLLSASTSEYFGYNTSGAYLLRGLVHLDSLRKSMDALLLRHSILRTSFVIVEGEPKQKIHAFEEFPFAIQYDYLADSQCIPADLENIIKRDVTQVFDLENGPLLSVRLIQTATQEYVLLFTMHHIISDGWSDEILVREFIHLYSFFEGTVKDALAPLQIQYKDYTYWHNDHIQADRISVHREYWVNQFKNVSPLLNFPIDYSRQKRKSGRGGIFSFQLSAELTRKLNDLGKYHDATLFMVLLAGLKALLYRYTDRQDIVIGTPIAGRDHIDVENQIGFYSNTLALRTKFNGNKDFVSLLAHVKETVLQAQEHNIYPFDDLVSQINEFGETSRSPLFDFMFVHQKKSPVITEIAGLDITGYELGVHTSPYDMVISSVEQLDRIDVDIIYDASIFKPESITLFERNFIGILNAISMNPSEAISSLLFPFSDSPATDKIVLLDSFLRCIPDGLIGDLYFEVDEPKVDDPIQEEVIKDPSSKRFLKSAKGRARRRAEIVDNLSASPEYLFLSKDCILVLELENRIRTDRAVMDCKIVNRVYGDGDTHLIAFVVTADFVESKDIKSRLGEKIRADILEKITFWPVVTLPLNNDGQIDIDVLQLMPVIKDGQLEIIEEQIKRLDEVEECRIVLRDELQRRNYLHLWDLLEIERRSVRSIKGNTVVESPARTEEKMAYLRGGDIVHNSTDPTTVTEAFLRTCELYPQHGIWIGQDNGVDCFLTYPDLLIASKHLVSGLYKQGMKPNDVLILQINDLKNYFTAFWGCVIGGIIPVTVSTSTNYTDRNNATIKLFNTVQVVDGSFLLCDDDLFDSVLTFRDVFSLDKLKIFTFSASRAEHPIEKVHPAQPADIIFYQLSSGSTGVPKCVQITHRGLVDFSFGTQQTNSFTAEDTLLNWMPFDHVGALIMYHASEVCLGGNQVQLKTELILANPLLWLDYIQKYKVTRSWSPNFGYKLIGEELDRVSNRSWNLSSLHTLLNGGEQVTLSVLKKFLKNTQPFGLDSKVIQPAYGMAEVCTAATYQNTFSFDRIFYIDSKSLGGVLRRCDQGHPAAYTFVNVGSPRRGVEVRIADQDNVVLTEGLIGRVQLKATSLTPGYVNNDAANQEAFLPGGWYNTGDLGFILDECLAITGREKEMIIIRGMHYYYYELEDFVGQLDGIVTTFVGCCSVKDPVAETEELIIFFTPESEEFDFQINIVKAIKAAVGSKFGIHPAYVIALNKDDFPKTTSGKIQRIGLRESFVRGVFDSFIKRADIALSNERNILKDWFFEKLWVKKELTIRENKRHGLILVFSENSDVIDSMRLKFASDVIQVRMGSQKEFGPEVCVINPSNFSDYIQLFSYVQKEGKKTITIVHAWMYTRSSDDPALKVHVQTGQQKGVFSILNIIKTLTSIDHWSEKSLWVVANDSLYIQGDEHAAIEKGTLQGFLKTASLELPSLKVRYIDIPFDRSNRVAEVLYSEIEGNLDDQEVAYRHDQRLVCRLRKSMLTSQRSYRPTKIRRGGLYLITGGLGAIGFEIAQYLLLNYEVKLLLVGRTALSSAKSSELDEQDKISRLQSLKKNGEFVAYFPVDIFETDELNHVICELESKWKEKLAGIIHTAGVGSLYKHYSEDSQSHWLINEHVSIFEWMFRSKVYGTIGLGELLREREDVSLICFSSVNSYLGGASFSAYSAANSFLDHYVSYLRLHGIHAQCLNWSMWDEMGMNANNHFQHLSQAKGFDSIMLQEGIQSFRVALQSGVPQLFIGLNEHNNSLKKYLAENALTKKELLVFYKPRTSAPVEAGKIVALVRKHQKGNSIIPVELNEFPYDKYDCIDNVKLLSYQASVVTSITRKVHSITEIKLSLIWQEILDRKDINTFDNFFELGGDSIKAARVVSRIYKELNVAIQLKDILTNAIFKELTDFVDQSMKKKYDEIAPVPQQDFYDVSYSQKRLWLFNQMAGDQIVYNVPGVFWIEGDLDISSFSRAIDTLVQRHESLRTVFGSIDGTPKQLIRAHDTERASLRYFDVSQKLNKEGESVFLKRLMNDEIAIPFDLEKGPLFTAKLFCVKQYKHVFLLMLHHIIADGWSLNVLTNELLVLYDSYTRGNNNPLPVLNLQYKDYSAWQKTKLTQDLIKYHRKYYEQALGDHVPVLNFPTDFERPTVKTYRGSSLEFLIEQDVSLKINKLCVKYEVTLYMFLMTSVNVLLHRYTYQRDIIVGAPIAGRDHQNLEDQVGMYVNTMIFRTEFSPTETFLSILQQVKKKSLEAYEHQHYPFDMLVEDFRVERDVSRHPLFDIAVNMQNVEVRSSYKEQIEDLKFSSFETDFMISKFDMLISFREISEGVFGSVEYNIDLFKKESIGLFIERFQAVIIQCLAHPGIKVDDIRFMSEELTEKEVDLAHVNHAFEFDF